MARGEGDYRKDGRLSDKHIRVGQVTVYRRGRRWYIYFREDGLSRRLSASRDLKEAKKVAGEVNAQLSCGLRTSFGYTKISIENAVAKWLEHQEMVQRSSLATVNRYRTAVAHLIRFVHAAHPSLTMDRLTTPVVEQFIKHLRTVPISPNGSPKATKRRMMDKGVINVLRACRALVNYAARHRHMPPYATNPFTDLRIERMKIQDAKQINVFTRDEEVQFLEACGPWEFGVFFTLGFTGLRPGELRHMLIEDVDLEARTALVRNHPELGWHTKTRNERRLHLFDELHTVFSNAMAYRTHGPVFLARRYVVGGDTPLLVGMDTQSLASELRVRIKDAATANQHEQRLKVEARVVEQMWKDMGGIKANAIRRRFVHVTRKMGRPELTSPYAFRHGMATCMQEAGTDPYVRKEIMGHTSLEMTGRYTHTANLTIARGMKEAADLRPKALEMARSRFAALAVGD